jgi:hypothetical protein
MPTKYVRYVELKPQYGIPFCRVHLKRKIAAGEFPEPVYLGPNTIAWREEEILAWPERKRTERDKGRKITITAFLSGRERDWRARLACLVRSSTSWSETASSPLEGAWAGWGRYESLRCGGAHRRGLCARHREIGEGAIPSP